MEMNSLNGNEQEPQKSTTIFPKSQYLNLIFQSFNELNIELDYEHCYEMKRILFFKTKSGLIRVIGDTGIILVAREHLLALLKNNQIPKDFVKQNHSFPSFVIYLNFPIVLLYSIRILFRTDPNFFSNLFNDFGKVNFHILVPNTKSFDLSCTLFEKSDFCPKIQF